MVIVGLVGIAAADVAGPSSCPPPALVATVPADGDAGLPPGVVLTLVLEDAGCGAPVVDVALRTELGDAVAVALVEEDGVVRAVPDAPLDDGRYVAEVTVGADAPVEIGFTVGGESSAGAPPEPDAVALSARRACEPLLVSSFELAASFPAASPADRGLLRARVTTEDGEVVTASTPYLGEPEATLVGDVFGGSELCVALVAEDVTGAVAWELEPTCAEPAAPCPDEEGGVGGLFGCSTAPLGGWTLLPLLLLATRRRR